MSNKKNHSIINKLRREQRLNENFLNVLSSISLEELIAIKLEQSSRILGGKLYNFPLWYTLPYMVRDALVNFVDRNCNTKVDMSNVLGIPYSEFVQIYRRYLE